MSAAFPALLTTLCNGEDLSAEQVTGMMRAVLSGEWTQAQTAAALTALKIKGEKPTEIAAAAAVMRDMAEAVKVGDEDNLVDTCGTGGDGARTFNISTAAAFVAAACGAKVAKHGNRAVSSSSGSFDVLDALGMPGNLPPAAIVRLIREVGIGFMFAPNHHAAVKQVMPVRRELGVRTLFNLLGPLTNPAGARRQVVGVFSPDLLLPYAESLAELGAVRAMVVHGGGLDEISISEETAIAELKDGAILRHTVAPEDAGLRRGDKTELEASSVEESKQKLLSVLRGDKGAARDVVLLNTAAALIVAGKAEDFPAGAALAAEAIDTGAAHKKLDEFLQAATALAP